MENGEEEGEGEGEGKGEGEGEGGNEELEKGREGKGGPWRG